MQKLLSEETAQHRSLLGSGAGMVGRNKRYLFWFYILNLTLAEFGAAAFRIQAHSILDHSLLADRLVHGLDLVVLSEMIFRPEFGPTRAPAMAATYFMLMFFAASALFLPGVLQGFASTYRLPRDEFFRACGRNLWRFIRLMIVGGVVMGIAAGASFGLRAWLVDKAGDSTNELLPFSVSVTVLTVIFLVMTTLRIWFDLAEADVVLSDQGAVRKSIAAGFRHTFRSLGRLLASYLVATMVAAGMLVAGLLVWMKFVAPENVIGAFVVGQLTLLLLLIPRFWQRGIAVSYYRQKMVVPVAAIELIAAEATVAPVVVVDPVDDPVDPPSIPSAPTGTDGA